jgi:hypothetical protein
MRNSTVRKVKRDGSVILQDVASRPWADYYEQHQARVETLRLNSDPQNINHPESLIPNLTPSIPNPSPRLDPPNLKNKRPRIDPESQTHPAFWILFPKP